MGDKRTGISRDIAAAGPLDGDALGLSEPEQVDLFGGDPARGGPVDESVRRQGLTKIEVRGRGRRAGSRNLVTADIVKFLNERYRHPLLGMADVQATSPDALAALVAGGEAVTPDIRKFAWQMWFQCAKELAEYMASKQPRTIALDQESWPVMAMYLGAHQMAAGEFEGMNEGELGFSKTQMNSMLEGVEDAEVLGQQVLQPQETPTKTGPKSND